MAFVAQKIGRDGHQPILQLMQFRLATDKKLWWGWRLGSERNNLSRITDKSLPDRASRCYGQIITSDKLAAGVNITANICATAGIGMNAQRLIA
jgi:hypothetical protein